MSRKNALARRAPLSSHFDTVIYEAQLAESSSVSPLVVGALGLAAAAGLAYAFWPKHTDIGLMGPAQRVAEGKVGQPVTVGAHRFVVAVDGNLVPDSTLYKTVPVAGKQLIVESDGAINLQQAPEVLYTPAGRVANGLVGKVVVIGGLRSTVNADGTLGHAPSVAPTPAAAPVPSLPSVPGMPSLPPQAVQAAQQALANAGVKLPF